MTSGEAVVVGVPLGPWVESRGGKLDFGLVAEY